jgi:hypothetical protein
LSALSEDLPALARDLPARIRQVQLMESVRRHERECRVCRFALPWPCVSGPQVDLLQTPNVEIGELHARPVQIHSVREHGHHAVRVRELQCDLIVGPVHRLLNRGVFEQPCFVLIAVDDAAAVRQKDRIHAAQGRNLDQRNDDLDLFG